jgi:hypothetical protein
MQRICWVSENPITRIQREALENLHGTHIPFLAQHRETPGVQTLCRFKEQYDSDKDILYIANDAPRLTAANMVQAAQRLGVSYRVFRSNSGPVVDAGNQPEHEIILVQEGATEHRWSKFKQRPQTAQAV